MPYLPVDEPDTGKFPKSNGADLKFALRVIEEKYTLFYPEVEYYPLKESETVADPANPYKPVQQGENTAHDPLYGESLPQHATEYINPHVIDADVPSFDALNDDTEQFDEPVTIHTRVQKQPTDDDIKEYGFEKVRDLICFVPASLLDKQNLTLAPGFKLQVNGEFYDLREEKGTGYWMNTNIALYRVLNCERRKAGS